MALQDKPDQVHDAAASDAVFSLRRINCPTVGTGASGDFVYNATVGAGQRPVWVWMSWVLPQLEQRKAALLYKPDIPVLVELVYTLGCLKKSAT